MTQPAEIPDDAMRPEAPPGAPAPYASAATTAVQGDPVSACIGVFAGYFEIGRLAAARRLNRAGVREPLLKA
jgi:hypothetical protein